jgi:hypothetical protein
MKVTMLIDFLAPQQEKSKGYIRIEKEIEIPFLPGLNMFYYPTQNIGAFITQMSFNCDFSKVIIWCYTSFVLDESISATLKASGWTGFKEVPKHNFPQKVELH